MHNVDQREPFFTAAERKATVIFRPREWAAWWRTEPLITKLLATVMAALLAWGLYIFRGNNELGWTLVGLVGGYLAIVALLVPTFAVLRASLRWLFRKCGITPVWVRIRARVLAIGKAVLWIGFAALILTAFWPYLSSSPTRSWYAFKYKVPAERVMIDKEPHDCEFQTAPLGSKHCHYDAVASVVKADDSADKQKHVFVSYERVED